MTPGELIRATRARHGLSQQRLARRAGTHQSAISRLEADEISPSVETLDLLMRAMGERLQLASVRWSEITIPCTGELPRRALLTSG